MILKDLAIHCNFSSNMGLLSFLIFYNIERWVTAFVMAHKYQSNIVRRSLFYLLIDVLFMAKKPTLIASQCKRHHELNIHAIEEQNSTKLWIASYVYVHCSRLIPICYCNLWACDFSAKLVVRLLNNSLQSHKDPYPGCCLCKSKIMFRNAM